MPMTEPKSMTASEHPLRMLALFYVAAFVASFNEIIINVAIVDIMESFAIGSVTAQWLVTLTSAADFREYEN